jgi:hypothetical protein
MQSQQVLVMKPIFANNIEASRFEYQMDGQTAFANYRRNGNVLVHRPCRSARSPARQGCRRNADEAYLRPGGARGLENHPDLRLCGHLAAPP